MKKTSTAKNLPEINKTGSINSLLSKFKVTKRENSRCSESSSIHRFKYTYWKEGGDIGHRESISGSYESERDKSDYNFESVRS